MDDPQKGSFRVVDKRGAGMEESPAEAQTETADKAAAETTADEKDALKEVNFVTFLFSLYSSALAAFGTVPDPATGKVVVHLEAGKQMIDILGILMEKTKGNLSSEESQLLDNILYELRMLYLEKTNTIKL